MSAVDTKSIFTSVTFWGAVVSVVAMFFPHLFPGLGISPDSATQYVVAAVGFIITLIGRFRATKAVSVSGK